ncbi:MAG: HepT-like ribonuclease domain-containing protein [Kineosporiaceae bacterium]
MFTLAMRILYTLRSWAILVPALVGGIEALAGLDAERREDLFDQAWPLMWGMRNRIAHGYLLVDADIVRRTLGVDIPPIIESIRHALS